jgi:hypothetical protein
VVLRARPGRDEGEQAVVHRLASARKAPKVVVERCRMVEPSWGGWLVPQRADELRCGQKTVRRWLHRFNRCGLEGLEDLGGQGRKRRITEAERSRIIGLVRLTPPGRLEVHHGVEAHLADVAFDGSLPAGGGRAHQGSGRTDVGRQDAGVVTVERLVQVPADPHGTTAAVQDRLHEVGDLSLPGAGLAANDDHDRSILPDSRPCRARKDHLRQHFEALLLGQQVQAGVLLRH